MTDTNNPSEEVGSEVNELLQKKDFGSNLRQAREKLGMSSNDVAENLLISVDIIKAIDNSQADALPALTFTQGYIRSYARLVGLSADEIITEYVLMAPDSKQVLTPHSVLPVQKSSSDIFIRFISFSFIIVAIVVLIVWLYKTDFRDYTDVSDEVAQFNAQPGADVQNDFDTNEIAMATPDSETVQAVQDEADNLSEALTVEAQVEAVKAEVETISAPEVAEVTAIKPANVEATGVDELFLSAMGESWCEIQDSTGKRMFYELLNRGQEVKLSGTAPFTVFLGNAPKVRVEVNNKIVDFERLINRSSNIVSIEITKDASVVSLSNR
ncbi:MAG: DUF4115 domain-containing protein [Gammaproteobacteria bacterium]|nr:DUF4115 domain-containing protein [Gammaproteobacteria bacterium]